MVKIEIEIISGVISCIMLMFILLSLLLMLSVLFCFVFGKKKLMLVILEVKLVLVKLYSREIIMKMLNGVEVFWIVKFS